MKKLAERVAEISTDQERLDALVNKAAEAAIAVEHDVETFAADRGAAIMANTEGTSLTIRRATTSDELTIKFFADVDGSLNFNISGTSVSDRNCGEDEMLDAIIEIVDRATRAD